eukprot:3538975-Prymnesium_polylepis.1
MGSPCRRRAPGSRTPTRTRSGLRCPSATRSPQARRCTARCASAPPPPRRCPAGSSPATSSPRGSMSRSCRVRRRSSPWPIGRSPLDRGRTQRCLRKRRTTRNSNPGRRLSLKRPHVGSPSPRDRRRSCG